ncbi:Prolycopene isomerase 2, chloroplastic [Dendrobium catenatum]|uniref:Prolycopene isomerase 2, chloroplastic n=1 Tax=Dendrobium catenatum TaxID=906689 RepID=A0A2I0VN19_9ASPA|nr:Prolycopene isomerase 2, chloroplastic [Dendrobium catenatum]
MLSLSLNSSSVSPPKFPPHSSFSRRSMRSWIHSPCLRRKNLGFWSWPKAVLSAERAVENGGGKAEEAEEYDAIVIGSGIGGLVAATQLAVKGARVLVLEKYVIPGGSSGFYQRDGFTFDVGSSVMFGFSDKLRHVAAEDCLFVGIFRFDGNLTLFADIATAIGTMRECCKIYSEQGNLNLITQALEAVDCKLQVIPDPTTVHFHLPDNLSVRVHREYDMFISELVNHFPHEKEGIHRFYNECWKIFNSLNSLELKSLEEPIYLFGQFFKKPVECLTLAFYLPQNAGDIARKFIKDPQLLSFIDAECFIVSTVNALHTPMINASMVLCDRHFGGINYPVGGVGGIAKALANGLVNKGSKLLYKANVTNIVLKDGKAVGVRLSDGREFFAKTVISNATRWDTFGKLLKVDDIPQEEKNFQKIYLKAPSFLSIHMGVKAFVLPPDTDCHHFILEGLSRKEYEEKKELVADEIITRLEKKLFPGLKDSVVLKEVGTPKTHRRFLGRDSGTYGPMPRNVPKGLLGMPFNTTAINGLYCVGDSCFPGQGVIAVAFSGIMCAHRVAADLEVPTRNLIPAIARPKDRRRRGGAQSPTRVREKSSSFGCCLLTSSWVVKDNCMRCKSSPQQFFIQQHRLVFDGLRMQHYHFLAALGAGGTCKWF